MRAVGRKPALPIDRRAWAIYAAALVGRPFATSGERARLWTWAGNEALMELAP